MKLGCGDEGGGFGAGEAERAVIVVCALMRSLAGTASPLLMLQLSRVTLIALLRLFGQALLLQMIIDNDLIYMRQPIGQL
jgi:hypothetical protein